MMSRKMISMLLAVMLVLTSAATAAADTYALSGDGQKTVTFYAKADGSARILFSQSEGRCEELSYTHLIDGISGVEEEWGKYHFYITYPDGSTRYEDWDKTFNGGSFSISLPRSGNYTIRVIPYTADEMTDSWTLDRFIKWTSQPHWQVTGCENCTVSTKAPSSGGSSAPGGSGSGGKASGSRDMGKPSLGGRVYRAEEMNMAIFWVQTQMKATGRWYQGDNWDCTGRLGDHTKSEISSFMRSRGYSGHSGQVDQTVIDELASYLGGRTVPVYVGGLYDGMSSIMYGGSAGSMDLISYGSHSTGVLWVQMCLYTLGYYSGSLDGAFGSGTERAVKAFQRDYGWVQRDYVTLGVARAMLEAYAARGGNINALP